MYNFLKVEAIIGKNDEAITNFEKVGRDFAFVDIRKKFLSNGIRLCLRGQARSIDPYIVTYMDEYAMLLKMKSEYSKLSKLVHDLLSIDSTRPEVFVALSALWERKDEKAALSNAEKVSLQNHKMKKKKKKLLLHVVVFSDKLFRFLNLEHSD